MMPLIVEINITSSEVRRDLVFLFGFEQRITMAFKRSGFSTSSRDVLFIYNGGVDSFGLGSLQFMPGISFLTLNCSNFRTEKIYDPRVDAEESRS